MLKGLRSLRILTFASLRPKKASGVKSLNSKAENKGSFCCEEFQIEDKRQPMSQLKHKQNKFPLSASFILSILSEILQSEISIIHSQLWFKKY